MNREKLVELLKNKWKFCLGLLAALMLILVFWLFQRGSKPDQKEQLILPTSSLLSSAHTTSQTSTSAQPSNSSKVVVDVKGAVNKPAVYTVSADLRVYELIQLAGGLTAEADAAKLNLAEKIQDAQVIYVPHKGEEIASQTGSASSNLTAPNSSAQTASKKVNINRADLAELMTLSGIGEKKAQDIIDYRQQNGSFKAIDDLGNISGIGDKTLEKIRDHVCLADE